MYVPRRKFWIDSDEVAPVVNLKLPLEMAGSFTAEAGVYPAYHMNKLHWVSVLLPAAPDDVVKFLLHVSHEATRPKKKKPWSRKLQGGWRRVWDSRTPGLSRKAPAWLFFCNSVSASHSEKPSCEARRHFRFERAYAMQQVESSHPHLQRKSTPAGAFVGGGCGIRTHVPVRANGFQDLFRIWNLTEIDL